MEYDFNLGAGQSLNLDVKGRFFKYKSGTGPIRIRTSLGGAVDLLPGQGVENVHFTGLTISDRSGAGNAGSILAGDFDFRDDRITGSVEVVDGGKNRTRAGQAFLVAAGGTTDPNFQSRTALVNAAGSGKNIFIETAMLTGQVAVPVSLCRVDAGVVVAVAQRKGISKDLTTFKESTAGQIFADANQNSAPLNPMWVLQINAGGRDSFQPKEPFMIPPGAALCMWAQTVGAPFTAQFEWFEEAI
jgi:hypothetical protein